MDVFAEPREVMRRFERYVVDLRRLFLFHGLPCGAAENFCDLAAKLEESRALRLDLPALLRNIRDLEQGAITADEMLTVVALASGGEELVEGRAGSAGMMRTVGLLQMMLAGVGTWAETNGTERTAKVVAAEATTGEDRVFLELAIEELRLQLGAVTRRMQEMEPGAGVAGIREAAAADRAAAERPRGPEREATGIVPGETVAEDRVAPAEVCTVDAEDGEREGAAAAEAERMSAAAAAAEEAAAAERERERAWPLEERVSSLPAMPVRREVAGDAGGLPEVTAEVRRGRSLRLGVVAAGLLLAAAGIYGSLRGGGRPAAANGEGASEGKVGVRAEVAKAVAPVTAPAVAVAPAVVVAATPEARISEARVGEGKAPAAAGAATAGRAVAKVGATAERRPAEVAKVAEVGKTPGRAAAAEEVAARDRRDDAAVAGRQAGGSRYVLVPAAVMETHLLSSRKAVMPAGAAAAGSARVVLNAFIAKDGTVSRTDVVEGPPGLVNAAMAAVSWRRYRPFLVRGEPAAVVTPVTVNFGGGR